MDISNKFKKAQSLPLNTIVIAMLVIIVLLVIIVFFTNSVSKSGDTINQNSATNCNLNNPVIKTLGYTDVMSVRIKDADGNKIEDVGVPSDYQIISSIPEEKKDDGYYACYGKK